MIMTIIILVVIIIILLLSIFSKDELTTQEQLVEYAEDKYCASGSIESVYQHETEEMWTLICKEKENTGIRTQFTLDKYGEIVAQKAAGTTIEYP